jgi:hypothetical protein
MSTCHASIVAVSCIVCFAADATAQDARDDRSSIPSLTVESATKSLCDPTTYIPAGLLYVSSRLDWDSSQPFFERGDTEENPRFTISGLPHDTPVSYGAGNRRILSDALNVASLSFANNTIDQFTTRLLTARAPEHQKLWRTLGWIERTIVASSLSYTLSIRHFEQWQENEQRAAQLGYTSAGS